MGKIIEFIDKERWSFVILLAILMFFSWVVTFGLMFFGATAVINWFALIFNLLLIIMQSTCVVVLFRKKRIYTGIISLVCLLVFITNIGFLYMANLYYTIDHLGLIK